MECIGKIMTLEILSLSNTQVSDRGLAHLTKLKNLRLLELVRCPITDNGLQHLPPNLRLIGLNRTKVSADAREKLQEQRPKLIIN